MKKWILLIVVIALAGGAYYFLRPADNAQERQEIEKVRVERGDLRLSVAATGTVTAHVEVEVKSKAGGEIVSFPFEEGDFLKKGQAAVKLDQATEQSKVNQANADLVMSEARLEKARVNLGDTEVRKERLNKLFDGGIVSRQELDDSLVSVQRARSDMKVAEADRIRIRETLKEAQDRLRDTEIRAPLSGTIIKKHVEEGQVIASTLSSASEGTVLLTMADLGRLYVNAMVDETDIGRIRPGQKSTVTVDAYLGRQFMGRVLRIAPKGRVESTVTVFDVVVEVVDEEKSMLRPMMTANVEILYDMRKDILLLPSEALKLKGDKTGVLKVVGEETVWTPVKAGETDGILTEISGDLNEGDEVAMANEGKGGKKGSDMTRRLWRLRRR